jgi:5-deoxy-glucuronate isomerase
MHIAPFDNQNLPIVGADHPLVPLTFFNIVKLVKGQAHDYAVPGYETCIVPATGTVRVEVGGQTHDNLGGRGTDVWDGEPEGVYVPTGMTARITCQSDSAEVFIAGAKFDEVLEPFAVRAADIDVVQYGSDDTKTHRKIKHILGTKYHGKVGRLLVSELFTVGAGGWSGFPSHKHDTDRREGPEGDLLETRHDETYNFRFRPPHGSGLQMLQREDGQPGDAYHIVDGSTVLIDKGYHPCCVLPGYEMYYFTILGGLSQRSLKQYFQPAHADQLHTIPGIMDMVAKFK